MKILRIFVTFCALKFGTICLVTGCIFVFRDHSFLVLVILLLVTYCFNYVIFPSFYLLADSRFRNVFKQKGGSKAIWLALKQKYE